MRGKCPRCGRGQLFDGYLKVADRCEVCNLDFAFADAGDGPAFFIICIAMVPVTAFAVWLEVAIGAPYWLNALLTLPVLLAFCLIPLKPLKGLMIAQQYNQDAREGQIAGSSSTSN